ncbi:MAG TPA: tRNA guanosine(34) transglycosylase Tgt [Terriglobia bacterium]|nr:tRNA guanosine(34) transglycosylase Tgt [Terriglobia bacterium]
MESAWKFDLVALDPSTRARAGLLHTAHGTVETPAFMPVGTAGSVKGIAQEELERLGVQILLSNTYHLYLRPGHEVIRQAGGLHRFMAWRRPILTDSGGYQVMSLKGLGRVTEDGVTFRSHLDGSSHFLSPERAVEIQLALGSDIGMILDECVEYPSSYETTRRAMELTGRWARRARDYYEQVCASRLGPRTSALFGIVQGGIDKALRRQSAEQMLEIGFDGYAVGGLSVGEPKGDTYDVTEYTAELLPADRPRYLMGVGTPADLVECVARGIDLFDCVLPTRNARNACVFTSEGRLVIKSARYASDERPLDPACACDVCQRYSRAYIRHLFQAGETLAGILATRHNLHFYLDTMRRIRQAVISGDFEDLLRRVRTGYLPTS